MAPTSVSINIHLSIRLTLDKQTLPSLCSYLLRGVCVNYLLKDFPSREVSSGKKTRKKHGT